ncbi:MAG: type II secretion system F family protein [Clostridia bacterium]
MPSYKYRVIYQDGKLGRGRIMALNKSLAIDSLKKDGTQPIFVEKMKDNKKKYKRLDYEKLIKEDKKQRVKESGKINFKNLKFKDLAKNGITFINYVSAKDLIIFSNNIYILKKAKFNNIQALEAVHDGTENKYFKNVIEDILIGVQSGERMYAVMENYPRVFPTMYINFVKVGEESGTLDTALLYARDYVESSTKLRKKITSAVIPRLLQFFGIIIAMFAALIIGVPLLQSVYDMFDSNEKIPAATMIGLNIAKWFVANWYFVVAAIGLLVLGFFAYINTPKGKYNFDRLIMKIPVIGPLNINITISKFFQAMLLNLKNGMRIQESLDISKNVTKNYYFLSVIEAGKVNALSGGSWMIPFEEKKLFKPMVTEMIDIGMKTDLAEMMEKVNEYIVMEIDESIAKFVKWLPDITYIFVGIALIFFMITVMVPLINVYMGSFIQIP